MSFDFCKNTEEMTAYDAQKKQKLHKRLYPFYYYCLK